MSDKLFENENTMENGVTEETVAASEIAPVSEEVPAEEPVTETVTATTTEEIPAEAAPEAAAPAAPEKGTEGETPATPKKKTSSSSSGKKKSSSGKKKSGSKSGTKSGGKTSGKKSTGKKKKKKKKKVTFQRSQAEIKNQTRRTLEACAFMLPWLIGLLVFFAYPIITSLRLSFSQITTTKDWQMEWVGFDNYITMFKDAETGGFLPSFINSIEQLVIYVPSIVILAMILAVLLNTKLVGRGILRSIFFLPVLLGTGYIIQQLLGMQVDPAAEAAGYTEFSSNLDRGIALPQELLILLPEQFTGVITAIFGEITQILWRSGVQILIFLSGLQSISPSVYESARVDGATEWEMFWKITIPSLAPVTVLTIVYTIMDTATSDSNAMIQLITNNSDGSQNMAIAAAQSWIYLFVVLAFVGIVLFFTRKQNGTADQQ